MAEVSQQHYFWEERRVSSDRRLRPTRSLHHYGVTGRRSQQRRKEDIGVTITDHFDKPVWLASLAIILLSVMDYILTMVILEAGGIELNAIMDHVIKQGGGVFFATKYCLTALAVFLLLAHHQHYFFRTIQVKTILFVMAFAYFSLFLYEIRLIASI